MDDLIAMEGTTQDQQLDHHHLEEGDQNLQSVSGGGEAANLPLLPEIQANDFQVNPDIQLMKVMVESRIKRKGRKEGSMKGPT